MNSVYIRTYYVCNICFNIMLTYTYMHSPNDSASPLDPYSLLLDVLVLIMKGKCTDCEASGVALGRLSYYSYIIYILFIKLSLDSVVLPSEGLVNFRNHVEK
jgi:hypothetical protein